MTTLAQALDAAKQQTNGKSLTFAIDTYMKLYRTLKLKYIEPVYELCVLLKEAGKYQQVLSIGSSIALSLPDITDIPKDTVDRDIYYFKFLDVMLMSTASTNNVEDGLTYAYAIVERTRNSTHLSEKDHSIFSQNLQTLLTYMRDKVHSKDRVLIPNPFAKKLPTICFYLGQCPMTDAKDKIYGSEIAAVKLAEQLSHSHTVFIVAQFIAFTYTKNNVHYLPIRFLYSREKLLSQDFQFDVMVVSRYINYFLHFDATGLAKKTYIWLHDTHFMSHMGPATNPGYAGPGQEIMHELGKNWLKNLDKAALNNIVTLSPWHREFFLDFYGHHLLDKVCIQGNGYDEAACAAAELCSKKKKARRFIWVSCPHRGLVQLVQQFATIRSMFADAELHIYRDTFTELQESCKLAPYIVFHGYKSNEQILQAMAEADYWLYPTSFLETFCISALEAQRMGCVCIATHLGALKTTLDPSRAVFLYGDVSTPQYWQQVFNALNKLEETPKEKERLRKAGCEWAKQQSWKHVAKRWESMFAGLNDNDVIEV